MKDYKNYAWAVNKVKLQLATADVANAKKFDSNAPDVSEESVKARYILRGGLIEEDFVADTTARTVSDELPAPKVHKAKK